MEFAKKFTRAIIVLIIIYSILLGLIKFIEYRTIYQPDNEQPYNLDMLNAERVSLRIDDSETYGLYKKNQSDFVILFFHGNAGNINVNYPNLVYMDRSGYSYFVPEYPGFGEVEGFPSEKKLYQVAEAAYDYLLNEKSYKPDQIMVDGQSLGGAVAADLAAKKEVRSVLIEGSFPSTHAMARKLFPYLPVQILTTNKFQTIEKVKKINEPILFLHGEEDQVIPPSFSKELYEAANPPKYLYYIPDFDHNDVFPSMEIQWVKDVNEFIETMRMPNAEEKIE